MTIIQSPQLLNIKALASKILAWFEKQHFEVKITHLQNDYFITARKTNAIRVAISADHAIIVGIRQVNSGTTIEVKQGSWETKILSNAIWFALTGGTNLFIAGWSLVLQKDLENYIETMIKSAPDVLNPHLSVPEPVPSVLSPASHIPNTPITNAFESTKSAISKVGKDLSKSATKLFNRAKNTPKAKYCANCGEPRESGSKFCTKCGKPF